MFFFRRNSFIVENVVDEKTTLCKLIYLEQN